MPQYLKNLLVLLLVVALPGLVFAGTTGKISGSVTDKNTGELLPGANVSIVGTTMGAASDLNGKFTIKNVPPGTYTLRTTFIGYNIAEQEVTVTVDKTTAVDFALAGEIISGATITVLADRAKPRETPVAFTDVKKQDMEARLGSQDIPLVMNTTPSVYATMQGGGAGDARVNVRGFSQENVAIMINGVPVNDMENAWLYWSNWDGVADATASIQMQRGLSAINLATPSIGGTMNIITDPTALRRGVRFKQEIGNDGFMKSTLMASSGLIDGKYAISVGGVRKVGDGLIDKTWTDAWAYYLGASYQVNAKNRLEFYALGAPQRHGQNLYKQNIAVYDKKFAEDLDDYDPEAFTKFTEVDRKFNQNWSPVSSSYSGEQAVEGNTFERHDASFINERENFYHKPIVNLNWYSMLTEELGLYTTVYYSGGSGGGTGTYGKVLTQDANGKIGGEDYKYYYGPSPWVRNWDATIAMNSGPAGTYYVDKSELTKEAGQSLGILRNSRNNQWTIGAISKAKYKLSDAVNVTAGIDWRTAEIEHYREVRDLLGGDYYYFTGNAFDSEADYKKRLGDKIDYNFTNTVDWLGFFGQAEYSSGSVTAYGMGGYSTISYTYTNHFKKDASGNEVTSETDWISGAQVKGGASYRLTDALDIFANGGYVSKVPIFDDVINDRTGTKAEDPQNQEFTAIEGGVNYIGLDGKFAAKGNFYYTSWKNKSNTVGITNQDGTEGIVFIQGMDLLHQGIEIEAAFQPIPLVRLDAVASLGNWEYTDDVSGVYKDYAGGGAGDVHYDFYVKDLKSGDAPQTQFALIGSLYPIHGMQAQVVLRHYRNHYAQWNPFSRTDPDDRTQSWQAPNYSVVDFHASYNLPFNLGGIGLQVFAHVFNALDGTFIQDATDNSEYNSWDQDHDADDAEVYFGLPRTFNVGLALSY